MSLMVSDNSLYLKNPETNEFLPVSIFNSGADKSMEKIAEFAESTKSEAEAVMTAKKTEISEGFREQLESQVDGVISEAKVSAEAAIESKKNEVLGEIPDSYTELQGSVNKVKDDIEIMNLLPLNTFPQYKGFPYNTKKWGNLSESYKHSIIPVKGGDKIEVTGSDVNSFIAFFTDYNGSNAGQDVPYSSYDGFNDRIGIKTSTKKYIVPEDVKYFFVLRRYDDIDVTPNVIKINHLHLAKKYTSENLIQSLDDIKNESVELSFIETRKYFDVGGFSTKWELGSFRQVIGEDTNILDANNIRQKTEILEFPFPVTVFCDKEYGFNVVLLDENELMTGYANGSNYSNDDVKIKAYQKFRLLMANQNTSTDISGVDGSQIVKFKINKLIDLIYPNNNNNVRWCAMGDSITEGYISYNEEPYYKLSKNDAWAYKLAKITDWELTNKAIGGTGFVRNNPDSADAGWNVAKNIDFTQFDFVTIAYGVNDWKYNCTLGTFDDDFEKPTTIYGAMRSTIETIIASNPLCKIFMISPVNCSVGGNESTNWGIGYSFSNNGTLEQICEAEKNSC